MGQPFPGDLDARNLTVRASWRKLLEWVPHALSDLMDKYRGIVADPPDTPNPGFPPPTMELRRPPGERPVPTAGAETVPDPAIIMGV